MSIANTVGWGWIAAVAAAVALPGPAAAESGSVAEFYAGRTVKLIVGLPPGGGADAYARLVQRHIGRHIPGAPTIVVQSMPGAGSLRSVMALNASDADGTTMVHFSSGLLTEAITSPDRVKVDFRTYAFIGNVSEDVRVCYLRSALGVHDFAQMRAHGGVIFAGSAAGTAGNANIAMLRNLFGVPLKVVQGYAGSAAKRLAIDRGEVDGDCGGWTSVPQTWLREKKIAVIVRLSPTLLPGMDAKVPFGADLLKSADERRIYDFLVAPERLGRLFMVAGAVPAGRTAALRRAFDAMVADKAFLAEADKARLIVTPMTGAEVTRRIADVYATPPVLIAKAKAIVSE
jgi:tripartite-type tricarboxylate transporter receptor subunit TctC